MIRGHNGQGLLSLRQAHRNFHSLFKSQSFFHRHLCPWYIKVSICAEKVPSPVCVVRMVYPAPLNHQKETIGSSFQSLQGSSGHLCQTWLLGAPFDLVVHVGHREETKNLD